ncbi:larval cuticle protein A3A-like [Belonocnema kinseyi]|uniref:larval cuticle protein A3A-like n=1 Tax=Belonocnema kinseyi TaxID=2817044 RepID=UPI00143DF846|nr:larval cuticle protein A3A-like [Belonocnema kinseyi]
MAFKFVVFAALVAVANAGAIGAPLSYAAPAQLAYASAPVAYAQPIAKAVVAKTVDTEYDPHPQYSYAYDVQDGLTGDSKGQHETREGDVVHGSYNLLEADGTRRIVDYTADPVNGFNAVVRKEPAAVAVKAVAAAPVVKAVAHAPVAYAAPQYAQYAAPAVAAAPALYAAPAQYAPVVKTVSHAPIVAQPALQYAQYAHAPVAYASAPHYGYAAAPAYYH